MLDGVAESWLDVTIERPTGAGDAIDEPRTVTVTPHGPRWA